MNWNTTNLWKVTFATIGVGIFLNAMHWPKVGEFIGIIGGIAFIIMCCARFEDVQKFLDRNNK
jgi:hypothetical protein